MSQVCHVLCALGKGDNVTPLPCQTFPGAAKPLMSLKNNIPVLFVLSARSQNASGRSGSNTLPGGTLSSRISPLPLLLTQIFLRMFTSLFQKCSDIHSGAHSCSLEGLPAPRAFGLFAVASQCHLLCAFPILSAEEDESLGMHCLSTLCPVPEGRAQPWQCPGEDGIAVPGEDGIAVPRGGWHCCPRGF